MIASDRHDQNYTFIKPTARPLLPYANAIYRFPIILTVNALQTKSDSQEDSKDPYTI